MVTPQKRDADKYQKFLDETIADKKRIRTEIQELRIIVAGHWRAFTSTLLTIDVALVGAMLAVLTSNSSKLIQNPILALIGILFLVIDAVLIVYYSVEILFNDDKTLSESQDYHDGTRNELIAMSKDYYHRGASFEEFDGKYYEKLIEFSEKEKGLIQDSRKMGKSGYWLHLMGYLFILGLVFASLSVIPLSAWSLTEFGANLCTLLHLSK